MKTKTYHNQTLNAYLLGALPDAEMELFDELSFTDDDFADELKVAEKDLVDAYVNGELSGTKLEQFKSYYLVSPLRREKVEFAQTFQLFAETELTRESVIESPPEKVSFFDKFFTIPRLSLQWGFALATLALMFFGGWVLWENSRLRSQMNEDQAKREAILQRESELKQREKQLQDEIANQQTANAETEKELAKIQAERERLAQELKNSQEEKRMIEKREAETQRAEKRKVSPLPNDKELAQEPKKREGGQSVGYGSAAKIASFILLPSLRSSNQLQTVKIPPKTDLVNMQLQLEADDFPTYRVVLQNPSDSKTLWQIRTKSAKEGNNKVLNLQFRAGLLKSNIYTLEVSGVKTDGTSEIISNYSFRVVP